MYLNIIGIGTPCYLPAVPVGLNKELLILYCIILFYFLFYFILFGKL